MSRNNLIGRRVSARCGGACPGQAVSGEVGQARVVRECEGEWVREKRKERKSKRMSKRGCVREREEEEEGERACLKRDEESKSEWLLLMMRGEMKRKRREAVCLREQRRSLNSEWEWTLLLLWAVCLIETCLMLL